MKAEKLSDLARKIRGTLGSNIVITAETDLVVDLGFDSLDITEFLYAIEDETGTLIDYSRLEPLHLRSLGALAEYLSTEDADDVP